MAFEDGSGFVVDPLLGRGVGFWVEAPGRGPQVFEDVHEVHDDGDGQAPSVGFGVDAVELVAVAVDEDDPAATLERVASFGLIEHLGDHFGGVVDDAGRHPLVLGPRPLVVTSAAVSDHVAGRAGHGRQVVDGADLGHALGSELLAFRQAPLELGRGRGGGPGRVGAEAVGPHDDALAVDRQHDDVARFGRLSSGLGVEAVDVDGAATEQLLDLTLADLLPGDPTEAATVSS